MGSPYAGNPALFPANFLIPDDGDPKNAASVGIGFEALGDRTANLKGRLDVLANQVVRTVQWASGATPVLVTFNDTPGQFLVPNGLFLGVLKAGDEVMIEATFYARRSNAVVNSIKIALEIEGASAVRVGETEPFGSGSGSFEYPMVIISRYIIPTNGVYTVELASFAPITPGAGATFEWKSIGAGLRATVIRPTP